MKIYAYLSSAVLLACITWLVPPGVLADELILQGQLQTQTYSTSGTIRTQGTCDVPSGTQVRFEASALVLGPGFRVQSGGTLALSIMDPDGLPNDCELQYFGNYDQGPDDDPDGDQLTNLQECQLGTDPTANNPDNDGDGLLDWWEVQYAGTNLGLLNGRNADADGDGVSNWIEYKLGTNPLGNDLPGPGIYYEYDELGRIKKIQRLPSR